MGLANMEIYLKCMIKSSFDGDVLTKKGVDSIKLQVEIAINAIGGICTNSPKTTTGIRVHTVPGSLKTVHVMCTPGNKGVTGVRIAADIIIIPKKCGTPDTDKSFLEDGFGFRYARYMRMESIENNDFRYYKLI